VVCGVCGVCVVCVVVVCVCGVCVCMLLAPSVVLAGQCVNVQFSFVSPAMQTCVLQEPSFSFFIILNFPNSLHY